jgi:hypothetical protein
MGGATSGPSVAQRLLHDASGKAHANPGALPTEISYRREVLADGVLDGLCVYFAAGFDPERWFTSSPAAPPTSWGSPLLRVEQRPVKSRRRHRGHDFSRRPRLPRQLDVERRRDRQLILDVVRLLHDVHANL